MTGALAWAPCRPRLSHPTSALHPPPPPQSNPPPRGEAPRQPSPCPGLKASNAAQVPPPGIRPPTPLLSRVGSGQARKTQAGTLSASRPHSHPAACPEHPAHLPSFAVPP